MLKQMGAFVDEASFAVLTTMMRVQRRSLRNQISDTQELEKLRGYVSLSPNEIFVPPAIPDVTRQKLEPFPQLLGLRQGYTMERLTFPSPITSGADENNTVTAWWLYRPGEEKAPTVIFAHGWMAYDPGLWMRHPVSWLCPLGYNVLMLELPHHMSRAQSGTLSGELSITADLPASFLGAQQGVADVRALLYWIKAQGVEKVGLMGKSMGGLVSSLTVTAEPGLECAVLIIPAVSASASLWHSNYTKLVRAELMRQGIDEAQTAELLAGVNPANHKPAINPERILIIEATGDRACPPAETDRLATNWNAQIERVPSGHMTISFASVARRYSRDFCKKWLG